MSSGQGDTYTHRLLGDAFSRTESAFLHHTEVCHTRLSHRADAPGRSYLAQVVISPFRNSFAYLTHALQLSTSFTCPVTAAQLSHLLIDWVISRYRCAVPVTDSSDLLKYRLLIFLLYSFAFSSCFYLTSVDHESIAVTCLELKLNATVSLFIRKSYQYD